MAETANLENVQSEEGPDTGHLEEDIETINQSKKPIDEKTGSHRQRIKQVVEQRGYNAGAFNQLCKIARMSEESRNDYLATLTQGLQIMLPKWQEGATGDLFGQDQETADNIHRMNPAAE